MSTMLRQNVAILQLKGYNFATKSYDFVTFAFYNKI